MTIGSKLISSINHFWEQLKGKQVQTPFHFFFFFFCIYRNKGKFPLYSLRVYCIELGKTDKYEKRGKLRNMERFIEGNESRGSLERGRKQVLEERNMPWPGESSRVSEEGTVSLGGWGQGTGELRLLRQIKSLSHLSELPQEKQACIWVWQLVSYTVWWQTLGGCLVSCLEKEFISDYIPSELHNENYTRHQVPKMIKSQKDTRSQTATLAQRINAPHSRLSSFLAHKQAGYILKYD